MKPMRTKDFIRLLETNGYRLVRSNGHKVYANALGQSIAIPHDKTISVGIVRQFTRLTKSLNSVSRAI